MLTCLRFCVTPSTCVGPATPFLRFQFRTISTLWLQIASAAVARRVLTPVCHDSFRPAGIPESHPFVPAQVAPRGLRTRGVASARVDRMERPSGAQRYTLCDRRPAAPGDG